MLKKEKLIAITLAATFGFSFFNGNLAARADEPADGVQQEDVENSEDESISSDVQLNEENGVEDDNSKDEENEEVVSQDEDTEVESKEEENQEMISQVENNSDSNSDTVEELLEQEQGDSCINEAAEEIQAEGIPSEEENDLEEEDNVQLMDAEDNIIWEASASSRWWRDTISIHSVTFTRNDDNCTAYVSGYKKEYNVQFGMLNLPSQIYVEGKYYTVTSIGDSAFEVSSYDSSGLDGIKIPDTVTSIGKYAFKFCRNLSEVEIPNSVTSIGEEAFYACGGIKNIEIPESVTNIGEGAFFDCYHLKRINLPSKLTVIDNYVFAYCSGLKEIFIPSGINSIGNRTFYECNNLKNIYVDDKNKNYIDENGVLFNKDKTIIVKYPPGKQEASYTIPETVTRIDDYAFASCREVQKILIPNSVTIMGNAVFLDAKSLTAISIPSSVTSVGYQTTIDSGLKSAWTSQGQYDKFEYNFRSLVLIESNLYDRKNYKDDVIKIKADSVACFEKCSDGSEKEIVMTKDEDGNFVHDPDKSEIGTRYYYYKAVKDGANYESPVISVEISNLTEDEKQPVWNENGEITIDGIRYKEDTNGNASVIKNEGIIGEIQIPSSITVDGVDVPVKSIARCAFVNCKDINKVIVPETVETIGESAFSGCSNLKEAVLPENLKSIGNCTFENCTSLENIEMPDSLGYIGMYSFDNCTSLGSIVIPFSVAKIDNGAFWRCSGLKNVKILSDDIEICQYAFLNCDNCTFEVKNENIKNELIGAGANEEGITIAE